MGPQVRLLRAINTTWWLLGPVEFLLWWHLAWPRVGSWELCCGLSPERKREDEHQGHASPGVLHMGVRTMTCISSHRHLQTEVTSGCQSFSTFFLADSWGCSQGFGPSSVSSRWCLQERVVTRVGACHPSRVLQLPLPTSVHPP